MRFIANMSVTVALAATAVSAQAPAIASFDVISITPNKSGSGSMRASSQGGRYQLTNGNVVTLVMTAYPLHRFEIVGAPSWVADDRFDVTATFQPANESRVYLQQMMRGLLADRFGFRAHMETRMVDALVLTHARVDGRLGPNIKRLTIDCEAWMKLPLAERKVETTGEAPTCGMNARPGYLAVGGAPLSSLTGSLSDDLGQRIVDETGLSGDFEFVLKWAPTDDPRYADLPSVYAAIQEQLGLKLEARKVRGDVLVIDEVRAPTPN